VSQIDLEKIKKLAKIVEDRKNWKWLPYDLYKEKQMKDYLEANPGIMEEKSKLDKLRKNQDQARAYRKTYRRK